MKKYEITFIVGENFTEDKAKNIAQDIRKLFETHGAKIEKEHYWGKRKLVYKIAKNSFGYYFILIFEIDPSKIETINHELLFNEKIIRYLLVDFIEDSPFFELEESKGKFQENSKPRKQENKKTTSIKEELIEDIADEIANEPEESVVSVQEIGEQANEGQESYQGEQIEDAKEKVTEKIEEEKEVQEKKEVEEEKKPEKNKKEEDIKEKVEIKEEKEPEVERKTAKKMTEDERKKQLEDKLAQLLKDEEV
uniref:Small ribosomal subunit protein bS6 n=1 Tax=candidate division CPR3 bacterium TaxID=2268181 RepID=A0A7C4M338_UNCC3